jgi:hypothetical protein
MHSHFLKEYKLEAFYSRQNIKLSYTDKSLFIKQDVAKDVKICDFYGHVIKLKDGETAEEYTNTKKCYAIVMNESEGLLFQCDPSGIKSPGMWANTGNSAKENDCSINIKKGPYTKRGCITSLRPLTVGEEIKVAYGR